MKSRESETDLLQLAHSILFASRPKAQVCEHFEPIYEESFGRPSPADPFYNHSFQAYQTPAPTFNRKYKMSMM